MKDVGRYLATRRIDKGLTQEELSDLISLSVKTISGYENGSRTIRVNKLVDFIDAIDGDWGTIYLLIRDDKTALSGLPPAPRSTPTTDELEHLIVRKANEKRVKGEDPKSWLTELLARAEAIALRAKATRRHGPTPSAPEIRP